MTANASIFAIPVYWIMTLLPHLAALKVLGPVFDNANPRSVEARDRASRELGRQTYALYERLEGAHINSLENAPLFFVAVIIGNLAALDAAELNGVVWGYIASRILYTFLYAAVSKGSASYARTMVFVVGLIMNFYLLIRGGVNLVWTY